MCKHETIRDQFADGSDTAVLIRHKDGNAALWAERSEWQDGSPFGWTRWTLNDDNTEIDFDPREDFAGTVTAWEQATGARPA